MSLETQYLPSFCFTISFSSCMLPCIHKISPLSSRWENRRKDHTSRMTTYQKKKSFLRKLPSNSCLELNLVTTPCCKGGWEGGMQYFRSACIVYESFWATANQIQPGIYSHSRMSAGQETASAARYTVLSMDVVQPAVWGRELVLIFPCRTGSICT
jgi:hypothetical protein